MRLRRTYALTAVAAVTTASLAALAVPAGASAVHSTAAHGNATSSLVALQLALPTETVTAGSVVAVAANSVKPRVAKLIVTPLLTSLTGPVGQQTVDSSNSPRTVPSTPVHTTLPAGLGSVTGPQLVVRAVNKAKTVLTAAQLKSLGAIKLSVLPLSLGKSSLSDLSEVTSTGAASEKNLSVGKLALPSVLGLLKALGIDPSALVKVLNVSKLLALGNLTGTGLAALHTAVTTAQGEVTAAGGAVPGTLNKANSALASAQAAAVAPDAAFATAWSSAFGLLPGPAQTTLTNAGLSSSSSALAVQTAAAANAAVNTVLTTAEGLVGTLAADLSSAASADALVKALSDLVTALTDLVNKVLSNVKLDKDPLASLGGITVRTAAIANKTATAAGAVSIGSVDVLGQLDLASTQLNSTLKTVTATLSSVLNSVAGVTFTPPAIALGKVHRTTERSGTARFASASVVGVELTLPSLTLPKALSLTGKALTVGGGSVALAQLTDTAQFTPATGSSTPTTTPAGSPLPDTGGRIGLSVLATVLVGLALVVRRRLRRL